MNIKKEKIGKNTKILIVVLIVVYFINGFLYLKIGEPIKKILTPKLQQQFYIDMRIYDENGEVAKCISAEEAYIKPLSKCIALMLVMAIVILISKKIIRTLYSRGINFIGIEKIVRFIEILVIFMGIFVFIYRLTPTEKKYGLYKKDFEAETGLSYYPVEELDYPVEYEQVQNPNIFERLRENIITKSENYVDICEAIVAISGALILPLRYCLRMESEKEEREKIIKMQLDIKSQVIEKIKREEKKANK